MFYGMTMNMQPVSTWSATDVFMLFIMWAIMMAGMMLPSAVPVLLLINRINLSRSDKHQSFIPTFIFSIGYILAWTFYSLIITFIQYYLHHSELLTPMMDSAYQQFSGAILVIAGIYQFTPLKQQCLKLCRSPLSILTEGWQETTRGAIAMGFKHGSYCVGCCWALMAILFVSGVMNLKWILLLTILVVIEKTIPKSEIVSKYIGALLCLLGLSYII